MINNKNVPVRDGREAYEKPMITTVAFDTHDVIMTSGGLSEKPSGNGDEFRW